MIIDEFLTVEPENEREYTFRFYPQGYQSNTIGESVERVRQIEVLQGPESKWDRTIKVTNTNGSVAYYNSEDLYQVFYINADEVEASRNRSKTNEVRDCPTSLGLP